MKKTLFQYKYALLLLSLILVGSSYLLFGRQGEVFVTGLPFYFFKVTKIEMITHKEFSFMNLLLDMIILVSLVGCVNKFIYIIFKSLMARRTFLLLFSIVVVAKLATSFLAMLGYNLIYSPLYLLNIISYYLSVQFIIWLTKFTNMITPYFVFTLMNIFSTSIVLIFSVCVTLIINFLVTHFLVFLPSKNKSK